MGEEPAAKRSKTGLNPEDVHTGDTVICQGGRRGVVRDAYAPLNEFWIADEATGELIRDDDGEIVNFRAEDLQLVKQQKPSGKSGPSGGASTAKKPVETEVHSVDGGGERAAHVLLLGQEGPMMDILQHFGSPDVDKRRDPVQQFLAVPCVAADCGPPGSDMASSPLCEVAADGLDDAMYDLARRLRPDIPVGVRPVHLKQAIERLGAGLRKLDGWYCLSAVTLPYSLEEIGECQGAERRFREVRTQIDLGCTACAWQPKPGEAGPEEAVRRALTEATGVVLSEKIWDDFEQHRQREKIGATFPYRLSEAIGGARLLVVIMPDSAQANIRDGLLHFDIPGSAAAKVATGGGNAGMSVSDWKKNQDQFKDLPKLPPDWIRIKSRSSDTVYFWNTKTNRPSYEFPLPEGWTKQVSKSTGKVYYFNARKRKSSFEVPTE